MDETVDVPTPDPVSVVDEVFETELPIRLARAVVSFRDELAKSEAMERQEAFSHAAMYLKHHLHAWVPIPTEFSDPDDDDDDE